MYRFSKNTQMSNFMKIRPVCTEFFMRTDRQTERKAARLGGSNSRFMQFFERP
jgi:hypothetical protein